MSSLSEDLLSENDIEAVLAAECCYDYGANSSKAVEKVVADQKDYNKSSLGVITNPYFIDNSKKNWFLRHL